MLTLTLFFLFPPSSSPPPHLHRLEPRTVDGPGLDHQNRRPKMDSVETLIQSAQGLYVPPVSSGSCDWLKTRAVRSVISTTAKVRHGATS